MSPRAVSPGRVLDRSELALAAGYVVAGFAALLIATNLVPPARVLL